MSNVVKEEVIIPEETKVILEEVVNKYFDVNAQYQTADANKKIYNKMVKDLFKDNNITKYTTESGVKASVSVQHKIKFDEEKLLSYVKTLNIPNIVKTQEYVDMDALESAIYNGQIDASKLQEFKEDKIVEVLKCTKPEVLKEG